jgi:GntR family transcriptional regulator
MVNRDHPLPLYYQLMQDLRSRIERGDWQPGDLVPSERDLCETHSISRMTVRRALAELTHEGLLRREPGRGTFVAQPKLRKPLSRLNSFTEEMGARGKQAGAQILHLEEIPAKPLVAGMLQVQIEQKVILVERLRLADGAPVAIEASHLWFDGCQALLRETLTGSIYRLLREQFGLIPTRALEEIEAGACGTQEARLLRITPSKPVLVMRRQTFDQHDRPFEYVESVYRADKYLLSVELLAEGCT